MDKRKLKIEMVREENTEAGIQYIELTAGNQSGFLGKCRLNCD